MLVGNGSVLSKHPGRNLGGGATGVGMNRYDFNKSSMSRGAFCSSTWLPQTTKPEGCRPPHAWLIPIKAGGMSATGNVAGSSTVTLSMASGVNGVANLTGSGDITDAALGLIVSLVASLVGSGDITTANLNAIADAVASLTGVGDITTATRTALANAVASLTGSGNVTSAVPYATGSMSADINVTGDLLTTGNVADAVWSALATNNNLAATMGELLNSAGAGGNPWIAVIEAGYTAEDILKLVAAVLLGESSGFPSAPEFIGLDGVTVRVSSPLDGDGNRSGVVLDPT